MVGNIHIGFEENKMFALLENGELYEINLADLKFSDYSNLMLKNYANDIDETDIRKYGKLLGRKTNQPSDNAKYIECIDVIYEPM